MWLVLVLCVLVGGPAWAEVFTIDVKRTGFFTEGRHINPSAPLVVPAGQIITLHFRWAEKLGSHASMDTHKIAVMSMETQQEELAQEVWWLNQDAYLAIGTGVPGTRYRGYCVVDCLGMSQLQNLLIISE